MGKIFITGGCGFIGVNAASRFLREGWDVVVFDNFSRPGSRENLAWLVSQGLAVSIAGDVRDWECIAKSVVNHADMTALIHLAGQVAVTKSVADPRFDCENNVTGTLNVLEAVRQAGINPAFLNASTNKVYGSLKGVKVEELNGRYAMKDYPRGIAEDHQLDFHSPYGCSKGAADMYVADYASIYGMRTVSLRQSCIYGYRQFGIEDQGWLAWFVLCALLDRPLTIYGDGKQVRDVLFIDDLVDCYKLCIQRIDHIRGQSFNVGGGPGNQLSLLELVKIIEKRVGRPLKLSFTGGRPGDQKVYVSGIGKAQRLLGWSPRTGIEDGVEKLYGWLESNRVILERTLHPSLAHK